MGTHGCIAASSPVSAISVGALRELLAQDLLAALGEIRCAIEQSDEGKVPYQLVGQPAMAVLPCRADPSAMAVSRTASAVRVPAR